MGVGLKVHSSQGPGMAIERGAALDHRGVQPVRLELLRGVGAGKMATFVGDPLGLDQPRAADRALAEDHDRCVRPTSRR